MKKTLSKRSRFIRVSLALFCAGTGMALLAGCIRTRVIVSSDPMGADVSMNNVYRGKTPVEIPFTWYWYHNFELQKEGYERVTVQERFYSPVYFWPPLDAVAEALPFPLYDTKRRHYVMVVRSPDGTPPRPGEATPAPDASGASPAP